MNLRLRQPARARLLVLVLVVIAACELTPYERFEPVLNVHCLLVGDTALSTSRYSAVCVDRTYGIEEETGFLDTADIQVHNQDSSRTWRFAFHDNCCGYGYYRSTMTVLPLDTLYLRVSVPGFDTVFGRTVVPDTFSIIWPQDNDTVRVTDLLQWTESRKAKGYFISYTPDYGHPWEAWFEFKVPGDSFAGALPMFFFSGVREQWYHLRLLALDTNYFDWAGGTLEELQPLPVMDSSHLTGGVGVFGSAVERSVRVYFKRDTLGRHRFEPAQAELDLLSGSR